MFFLNVQNEAEADRSRLRVPEEMLRDANRREPAATEGGPGAESPEASAAVLHAAAGGDSDDVPFLRENRRRRRGNLQQEPFYHGSEAPFLQPLHQPLRSLLVALRVLTNHHHLRPALLPIISSSKKTIIINIIVDI